MTEDRDVLAELGELLRRHDPVPDEVRALAEALFALAFLPAGLIRLEPVAEPVPVRSGTRSFRFGDNETFVKVDVRGAHLVGLVFPVVDVELCTPSGSRRVRPDDTGLFRLDDVPRGPLRVVVGRSHVTRWFWP